MFVIEKIIGDGKEEEKAEKPTCQFCKEPLMKKPEQYPINKLVQHFQGYVVNLQKAIKKVCLARDFIRMFIRNVHLLNTVSK